MASEGPWVWPVRSMGVASEWESMLVANEFLVSVRWNMVCWHATVKSSSVV